MYCAPSSKSIVHRKETKKTVHNPTTQRQHTNLYFKFFLYITKTLCLRLIVCDIWDTVGEDGGQEHSKRTRELHTYNYLCGWYSRSRLMFCLECDDNDISFYWSLQCTHLLNQKFNQITHAELMSLVVFLFWDHRDVLFTEFMRLTSTDF